MKLPLSWHCWASVAGFSSRRWHCGWRLWCAVLQSVFYVTVELWIATTAFLCSSKAVLEDGDLKLLYFIPGYFLTAHVLVILASKLVHEMGRILCESVWLPAMSHCSQWPSVVGALSSHSLSLSLHTHTCVCAYIHTYIYIYIYIYILYIYTHTASGCNYNSDLGICPGSVHFLSVGTIVHDSDCGKCREDCAWQWGYWDTFFLAFFPSWRQCWFGIWKFDWCVPGDCYAQEFILYIFCQLMDLDVLENVIHSCD